MSYAAFCVTLCQRALRRPESEVPASRRPLYEARLRQLAARLIGAGL
jgi:hypothetical protein